MHSKSGLIFSGDDKTVLFVQQVCDTLDVNLASIHDMNAFLLRIMEDEFVFLLFDCTGLENFGLSWIKLVRQMRPKFPLIVLSDDVDQEAGGRILEEGIFYLAIRPFQSDIFSQVLKAALEQHNSQVLHSWRIKECSKGTNNSCWLV